MRIWGARQAMRLASVAALSAIMSVAAAGCSSPTFVLVDEGRSYTLDEVAALQATVDRPAAEGRPVAEAAALRREALIEARGAGATGAELAEFVTRTVPDNGRSVPYYGEAAVIDGVPAWVLLEIWGAEESVLENTRAWAFDRESGAVLFSASGP